MQTAGLVERRAGSGTFVRAPRVVTRAQAFGVLMPEVGDVEVFDAICHGLLEAPEARQHVLVWGSRPPTPTSKADQAWRLCEQYIERQVDGVFFAPIELTAIKDSVNRRIADALAAARIPVVLIDRAIEPFPRRGRHDLVGLDNRRAGALVTEHLLVGRAAPARPSSGCPTRRPASTGAKPGFGRRCARRAWTRRRRTSGARIPPIASAWRRCSSVTRPTASSAPAIGRPPC